MNTPHQAQAYELLIAKLKKEYKSIEKAEEKNFRAAFDAMDFINEHGLSNVFAHWIIEDKSREKKFLQSMYELYELKSDTEAFIKNELKAAKA